MSNFALITGASSGIGLELAELVANNHQNVVLVARRTDRLKQLSSRLEKKYDINALCISKDLSQPGSAQDIFDLTEKGGIVVDCLINNAGSICYGNFAEAKWSDLLALIQLQILALTHLTKLFLPDMLRRNKGRILNIGSTGSFSPGPFTAVYCATKSYVLSLSEAIAEEVKGTGVTVTTLCPGGVRTDFDRSEQSFLAMKAGKVARIGYRAMLKKKRIVVPGLHNKIPVFLARFLPRSLMSKMAKSIILKHR